MRAAPFLFAMLIGCTPAAEHKGSPASAVLPGYQIVGEERPNWSPGWRAVIEDDRLLLDSPTSAGWYAAALPAPEQVQGRRIYRLPALSLRVQPGACAIADLKGRFPDAVELDWDGGSFAGCGGPRELKEGVGGTTWELIRIGGDEPPETRSPAVIFMMAPDGAVGGTAACNDAGTGAKWRPDGGFTSDPEGHGVIQTAMGCNQPAAERFSGRFWNLIGRARTWRRDGDRLFITASDGEVAELRYLVG